MTAVEWLENKINDELEIYNNQWLLIENFIEQAKEMEKQQISNAWLSAWKDSMLNPLEDKYYQPEAEQYFNETYKK